MRIGELLLLQERIDPWLLSHTLKEQATTQQRLVSLLVSRAQLDPDEGALLLSEQLGYAAALQRHLERRDPAVLELLPRELGSRWVVLPIGRARTGGVVVVARDPTPVLAAALEHAMKSAIILAVTPSVQLERLVRAAYGAPGAPDDPIPVHPPTLSDIGDAWVADDTPLPIRRARTVSYMFAGGLEITLDQVDHAITVSAVERLVMGYVAKRWSSSQLFRIDGDQLVAIRGHGAATEQPDALSDARVTRQVVRRNGVTVAPVVTAGQVVGLLAVGEPLVIASPASFGELDRLVDALGAAYNRFSR